MTGVEVVRRRSTAGEFHALAVPDPATSQVWVHEVTAPALVLGSTQSDDDVDLAACRRRGVEVVRRRSGGGAVWLVPGEVVWVDVIVPAGGPGWSDDVHVPMVWLGRHLRRAFAELGVSDVVVHDAPMVRTAASAVVCFDGLAPGELTRGGAKLVGTSQRRVRHAARLQCCWYVTHDHGDLVELLATPVDVGALRAVATVDAEVAHALPDALVRSLRAPDGLD
ncbi:lipoyl protein ligase domain-containing protein [Ilumatobacter sp.]|uniref:lipoyl protein ligase domain-containing protein n=1 Tax=Ilumatobacter sp. TaxID=1967498 RepID=UPI003B523266